MSPKEAEKLLLSKGTLNDIWVRHSFKVRDTALVIGDLIKDHLDLDFLEASALLHDIGRFKTHGIWHTWEGWVFLNSLGEKDVARVTITHWLKGRSIKRILKTSPNIDKNRIFEIFRLVKPIPLTIVDIVVSVADAFVAHDKVVPFSERFRDLRERYGDHIWLKDSERLVRAQAKRLGRLAGVKNIEKFVLDKLGS